MEVKKSNPDAVLKEIKPIEEASQIFERLKQSEEFVKIQPLFYDKAQIWWLWNFKKFCYEGVDEVDILNGISKSISLDTTNSKTRTEILNGLKQIGRQHIPQEAKETWMQFKDKIIDAKTGEELEASPEFFVTNPIPWEIGETEDTPVMDKLFREWVVKEGVQGESYIDTLYEEIAYSGLSHQFLQRLFALTGIGSNGKGCFLKLVTRYLGGENTCSTELKLLTTKQFETSALYKKLACFMTEVDVYDMNNTNLLKKLTGEDDIRYEFKRKTPFKERSATTCFMATNSLPVTPDQSFAYYRRWLIVDFPHVFPVGKDVIGEIPDIEFNNLAKKCVRICRELYEKRKFTNEGNYEERKERYEERSNPLMKFIELEVEEDPEEYTIFADFYKRFMDYLKYHRLRVMTKRAVTAALRNEGFQVKGRKTVKEDGSEAHTTCVFSVKLKEKTTETHQNTLNSEVKPHVEVKLKKECVSMGSDGQRYKVIADMPEFVKLNGSTEPKHKPGDIIKLDQKVEIFFFIISSYDSPFFPRLSSLSFVVSLTRIFGFSFSAMFLVP